MRRTLPVEERFWSKVDRRGPGECWPWQAAVLDRRGYGYFGLRAGQLEAERDRTVLAHRAAFRLVHGHWPDPDGLHGCDNPICCNAENLEHVHEGTPGQNTQEMWDRRRRVPKVDSAQVLEILARHRAGVSDTELAAEYGIARSAVWYVWSGRHSLVG